MSNNSRLAEARAAYDRGDYSLAAEHYRAVLDEFPGSSGEAFHMLGTIAHRMGKMELALQLTEAAIEVSPNMANALINRAVFLRQLGRKKDAREAAKQTVQKCPQSAEAWHTASFLALEAGEHENAYSFACEAMRLGPEAPLTLVNYANTLMVRGELVGAYDAALKALLKAPNEPLMHLSIGQILRAAGYPLRAIPHFQEAVKLRPNYVDAKAAAATAFTVVGDWKNGWAAWEDRPYDRERFKNLPRWNGAPVKTLLLHSEQGMGDGFQFLRWIGDARSRAEKVVLQVPKPLHKIISDSFEGYTIITPEDALPEANAHCPMMSLPYLFHPQAANYGTPVSLKVGDDVRAKWRERLEIYPQPRIGLIWYGNPNHTNDYNRSIPKECLSPLFNEFSENIFSLQDGAISRLEKGTENFVPMDVGNNTIDPVISSAALMQELDLVVTVDTMPVHLAGSLGVPTWLLIPFDPDWRWFYGREDTPWYPSVRLFRQQKPKDWATVIESVMRELRKLKTGDKSVLIPPKWTGDFLTQHPQALPLKFE